MVPRMIRIVEIIFLTNPFKKFPWQNEAGLAGAPAKAVSAVKEMNIPQKIKDINIKLPDMPSLGNLKFLNWSRERLVFRQSN